jgi:hypothetical protein
MERGAGRARSCGGGDGAAPHRRARQKAVQVRASSRRPAPTRAQPDQARHNSATACAARPSARAAPAAGPPATRGAGHASPTPWTSGCAAARGCACARCPWWRRRQAGCQGECSSVRAGSGGIHAQSKPRARRWRVARPRARQQARKKDEGSDLEPECTVKLLQETTRVDKAAVYVIDSAAGQRI